MWKYPKQDTIKQKLSCQKCRYYTVCLRINDMCLSLKCITELNVLL